MYYPKDTEMNDITDFTVEHHLILDGTVHLDDDNDDSIPCIRGLVELFSDYLGN